MKKIIVITFLSLCSLYLIVLIFKPTATSIDTTNNTNTKTSESPQNSLNHSWSTASLSQPSKPEPSAKEIKSKLSATALQYYKNAYQYGWESIVKNFENGAINQSDMSEMEKKKICSMAIKHASIEQTKRLFNTSCKVQTAEDTYYLINSSLKNEQGEIDQSMIIEKLKFYHDKNLLQTHVTYRNPLFEEKSNLQVYAVGFGLEQVSDYLISIGVAYQDSDSNLILTNINGKNPTISMIQKLEHSGMTIDEKIMKRIEENDFHSKHPEVYQYLKSR